MPGCCVRIRWAATSPSLEFVGGIRMSVTTTSGFSRSTTRWRASASPACPTTRKPFSARTRASPSRKSTESSASTTRTTGGAGPDASPGPGPAAGSGVAGYLGEDTGPPFGRAVDNEAAAYRGDAVLQSPQAGAPGRVGSAGPVVADLHAQGPVAA